VHQIVKAAGKRAGIKGKVSPHTKSELTTPFINKDNLQKGDRQNVIGSNPVGKQEKKVSIINKFSLSRRKRHTKVTSFHKCLNKRERIKLSSWTKADEQLTVFRLSSF
jgi:hypothetical protein